MTNAALKQGEFPLPLFKAHIRLIYAGLSDKLWLPAGPAAPYIGATCHWLSDKNDMR